MPSLTIALTEQNKYSKDNALSILNKIELTSLKDITKSMRIFYDPNDYSTNIEEDRELLQIYKVFHDIDPVMTEESDGSEWIIRFELDKQAMMDKNITMEMIYHRINVSYGDDISCVYSDDNSSKLIFRVRIMKLKKGDSDKYNDLNTLKAFGNAMREKIIIKGVSGINSVSMFKNKNNVVQKNASYEQKEEWVLDTNGVNLLEILRYPGVDSTRTISNDIYEMYETFGIEAAKNILMREIKEVMIGAGSYVNYRHLSLLVDTMTNRGYLMSIDRFGINRGNIGPLAKCSFEETTDQLFKASIFGEVDKLNGVSSNIMMGQIPNCGTGETDILIDESKLLDVPGEDPEELEDLDKWENADYCDENIGMEFDESAVDTIKSSSFVKTELITGGGGTAPDEE
jgi:DNA-directed RNA polymerase II subunit RPB1